MRQKLFTLCSAVSLLLCAALCVLWVKTERDRASEYRALQQAVTATTVRDLALSRDLESVGSEVLPAPFTPAEGEAFGRSKMDRLVRINEQRIANWGEQSRLRSREDDLTFRPTAWVYRSGVCLGLVIPVSWAAHRVWLRHQARRRRREGLCRRCGYDLRATPGRCPECGAETAGPVAA